ncbi:hypothetical protein BH10ACT3_BH10ACT3_20700 [soil metagenome]
MADARLALVTTAGAWETDEDAEPLVAALAELSITAVAADWDDADRDWSEFELVVLRSPWNYTDHVERFLAWAERVEAVSTLVNPLSVLRWNTDKHYLDDLARAGLPVVATSFVHPDDPRPEDPTTDFPAHGMFVVKPAVSAGSKDTARYAEDEHDAAAAHVRRLLDRGRDVMIQPYMDAVDDHGETGMLFFDGEFSHAFRKGALLTAGVPDVGRLYAVENIGPREPSAAELALAHDVLEQAARRFGGEPMVYDRVDVLPGADGKPMLLELELAEPSYFLSTDPAGAHRAAAAYAHALERSRNGEGR